MCWTDAAVMRCAQGERGGRGGDEKCKVRKGMTEVTDRYTDGWKTYCGDSNWQADRQTDTEGERNRGQNCFFFFFQIKGQAVQRLGQALSDPQIKQSSAALEGRGPLWSQITPQQYLTQHKRASGPLYFMSRLAIKHLLTHTHWEKTLIQSTPNIKAVLSDSPVDCIQFFDRRCKWHSDLLGIQGLWFQPIWNSHCRDAKCSHCS